MESPGRLLWLSTAHQHEEESRFLNALETYQPTVVQQSEIEQQQIRFSNRDTVVLNLRRGGEAFAKRTVLQIRSQAPRALIVVRDTAAPSLGESSAEYYGADSTLDPFEGPDLTRARVARILADRNSSTPPVAPEWRKMIIGESVAIRKVIEIVRLIGPRRCTVLITGETGTGKEIVARAIHRAGPRANAPFVALNCSAIPATLLEAELFGHTKGAFTGALQGRSGRFEEADGGTLFLDEIGEMPLDLQAKLLRVLQEREFQRLGSSETLRSDARVVAATNSDLAAKVREGTFRADLLYRLNVVPVSLPPLRARGGDIPLLADFFLKKICAEEGLVPKEFTSAARTALREFAWPGNVRQLENAVASAAILSEDRSFLDTADLHLPAAEPDPSESAPFGTVELPEHGLDFARVMTALERDILTQALRRTRGNKKLAADMLRLKRTTLCAKVRVIEETYGLQMR